MQHRFQKGNKFGPTDRTKNLGQFAEKGVVPWNKGLTKDDPRVMKYVEKWVEKMKINHPRHWLGKKRPEMTGENHWNWKGGIPRRRNLETIEYKLWRHSVFERDDYTCISCGDNQGGNLNADHIKPWALYPELRFAIDNGQTLCEPCHDKKTAIDLKVYWKDFYKGRNIIRA